MCPTVKVYEFGIRNKTNLYYRTQHLLYHPDLGYYIRGSMLGDNKQITIKYKKGNTSTFWYSPLEDYERKNGEFILKEKN